MKSTPFMFLALTGVMLGMFLTALPEATKPVSYQDFLKAHPRKGPVKPDDNSRVTGKSPDAPKPVVDFEKPIDILNLKDGRTYKNVRLITFTEKAVTLRWEGGAATVEYKLLPDDIRSAAEAKKPNAEKLEGMKNKKAMTPRGPYYVDGQIIQKAKGVIVIECSGPPPFGKFGKMLYLNGTVAVKNHPEYVELGVKDNITISAMRVGDYDSNWGQVPLVQFQEKL